MSGEIVVFGATGYTGDLTARALVARGARPVLAARNPARLAALAEELGGLETRVADVTDPASVAALVGPGDVLAATVGPFSHWGAPAVEAAIGAGAHYLDCTGEGSFIRRVFEEWGPRAAASGTALVTAFGYDWVPGNLAGALALRDAGEEASRVEVAYYFTGAGGADAMSGGTRASAAAAVVDPTYTLRGGRIVTERAAARVRSFATRPGRTRPAVSVGSSEAFALPRLKPGLAEVDVYLGWFGPASRPMSVMSAVSSVATKVPGVRGAITNLAGRFAQGSTGGPDEAARSTSGSLILASAYDAGGGLLSEVRIEGVNGYTFTAEILAWGAMAAADGGLQGTGALGPVDGFGLEALQAGVASAGLNVV